MNEEGWEEKKFDETLELLREAHREPIPEAHYAAVRARVLAQLQAERRPWWRGVWAYGLASVAIAATLLLAFWPKHTLPKYAVDRPPVIQAARQTVELSPEDRVPQSSAPGVKINQWPRLRRRHRASSATAYAVIGPPNLQPLVVKMITNDPDIVIYWISGE